MTSVYLKRWMLDHCIKADIKFVGVWDTVGSLIGLYDYLETGLRIPIINIFHAIALDEHRLSFKPTLLTRNVYKNQTLRNRSLPRPILNVEQRWFVGAHANVGGGYASDPLSQRPLIWITGKAMQLGLQLSEPIQQDADTWSYPVANSFREFAFYLYQFLTLGIPYYRQVGRPDWTKGIKTTENVNETIDGSVFERWQKDTSYRPDNLKAWAKLYNADPDKLKTSVMAKDPKASAPD